MGEHEDAGPAPFIFDTSFTNDRPGATVVFPRNVEPITMPPISTFVNDHMDAAHRGHQRWISPDNVRANHHSGGPSAFA